MHLNIDQSLFNINVYTHTYTDFNMHRPRDAPAVAEALKLEREHVRCRLDEQPLGRVDHRGARRAAVLLVVRELLERGELPSGGVCKGLGLGVRVSNPNPSPRGLGLTLVRELLERGKLPSGVVCKGGQAGRHGKGQSIRATLKRRLEVCHD